MEQTECSETSAYKIQTPRNYPEENIQHTVHGESLKSRTIWRQIYIIAVKYFIASVKWLLGHPVYNKEICRFFYIGASNLTFWHGVLWDMIVCCLLVRMSISNPLPWILLDICQQRNVSSAKWWARPLISTRESYKPSYQSGLQSVEISTLPQHSRGKHFDCGWIDCTPRDQPYVSDTFLTLCQQWNKTPWAAFPSRTCKVIYGDNCMPVVATSSVLTL